MSWVIIACFAVIIRLDKQVSAHPQCLDFQPPFENQKKLSFCSQYSDFGCCHQPRDQEIESKHSSHSSELTSSCQDKLKDLLCQECSPYAIHIYDAESNGVLNRTSPGICEHYCHDMVKSCPSIIQILTEGEMDANKTSADSFCASVSLEDKGYCFPELLNDPRLNGDISPKTRNSAHCLCLQEFASGLANPLIFRTVTNDERIFIGEQIGVVHIYFRNGTRLPEPFMDIKDLVLTSSRNGDERGLLGLALHPDFVKNQRLFVFFSISSDGNQEKIRISEFHVDKNDTNKVNRDSEKVLLEVGEPWWNHNGGELLFGTDGYLYAFIGDGGSGGDPMNNAQNKSTLLGKVIRIDVDSVDPDGLKPYKIPDDNPFIDDNSSLPEIFALGIRNTWRCDVDEGHPETGYGKGRIFCGDVGQSSWEEINLIKSGANLGWNSREGFACFNNKTCNKIGPEVLPIFAYPHSEGRSVTGGHVYRGCLNPNLQGYYIYGDYMDGRIWSLHEEGPGNWTNEDVDICGSDICLSSIGLTSSHPKNILSFGEDQDGEIYMVSTDFASPTSAKSKIFKFVDPHRRGNPRTCRTAPKEDTSAAPPTVSGEEQGSTTPSTINGGSSQMEAMLFNIAFLPFCVLTRNLFQTILV